MTPTSVPSIDPRTGFPGLLDASDHLSALDRLPLPYELYGGSSTTGLFPPGLVLPSMVPNMPMLTALHWQQSLQDIQVSLYLARLRAMNRLAHGPTLSSQSSSLPTAHHRNALLPHNGRIHLAPPILPPEPVVSSSAEMPLRPSAEEENQCDESSTVHHPTRLETFLDSGELLDSNGSPPPPPSRRKRTRRKPTPEDAWEIMFKQLVNYRIQNGNCLVREKDYPKLGRWVRNQRNRKKQHRLTPERIDRLESIDFVWCMVSVQFFNPCVL